MRKISAKQRRHLIKKSVKGNQKKIVKVVSEPSKTAPFEGLSWDALGKENAP